MVFWGVILIAIGVGALVGLKPWPVVLIGIGGALLGSVMLGNRLTIYSVFPISLKQVMR